MSGLIRPALSPPDHPACRIRVAAVIRMSFLVNSPPRTLADTIPNPGDARGKQ